MEILRTSIVTGELAPGSLHSVGSLAETLGVSRTPVREALIELASRGMVRFERNRGVRVLEMSAADLNEIFELRRFLEVPAIAKSVANMTPAVLRSLSRLLDAQDQAAAVNDEPKLWELDREFHRALLLASGNRRLANYVTHLGDVVAVSAMTAGASARAPKSLVEHRRILDSVAERDANRAAEAVLSHLELSLEMLTRSLPEIKDRSSGGLDTDPRVAVSAGRRR